MNILKSTAVFDANLPPLEYRCGREEHYYRRCRDEFQAIAFVLDNPELQPLYCSDLYKAHLLPGARYRRQQADFLSVEYVKEGSILFRQQKRGYRVEAGEIFLLRPGAPAEFMLLPEQECVKYSLLIRGWLLPSFIREGKLRKTDVLPRVDVRKVEEILRELEFLGKAGNGDTDSCNGVLAYRLMQFLLNPEPESDCPVQVRRLQEYLSAHLSDPLCLRDMAGYCGCSVTHLVRVCRKALGLTPYQLLLQQRMKKALLLLANPRLSIKEIAARTGYRNALVFSMEFRKRFAASPRKYRHEHRQYLRIS